MLQYAILESNNPEFKNNFIYASIGEPKNAHLFGGKESYGELPKESVVTRISEDKEFFVEHIPMEQLTLLGYSDCHINGTGLNEKMNQETLDYIKYVNG